MADFVEMMKIEKRLCESTTKCEECVLHHNNNGKNTICGSLATDYPEETQEILLKWDKEHPIKTNADKFEEVYGFRLSIFVCPWEGSDYCNDGVSGCKDCERTDFWKEEYKKPEESNEDKKYYS